MSEHFYEIFFTNMIVRDYILCCSLQKGNFTKKQNYEIQLWTLSDKAQDNQLMSSFLAF